MTFKTFYDDTISDDRDSRTVPFTRAEFSNVWARHRGGMFHTDDLRPFHAEFDAWLDAVKRQAVLEARRADEAEYDKWAAEQ